MCLSSRCLVMGGHVPIYIYIYISACKGTVYKLYGHRVYWDTKLIVTQITEAYIPCLYIYRNCYTLLLSAPKYDKQGQHIWVCCHPLVLFITRAIFLRTQQQNIDRWPVSCLSYMIVFRCCVKLAIPSVHFMKRWRHSARRHVCCSQWYMSRTDLTTHTYQCH
jgi:hypothetical protein